MDGSLRFFVDYLDINALYVKEAYSIPRMDQFINSLGEDTVFTTLDANWGYWQIDIYDRDKDRTTFT